MVKQIVEGYEEAASSADKSEKVIQLRKVE